VLEQRFTASRPDEVWHGDITYVATDEGWLYLAALKDQYTCEIVGYAMGARMTQDLVTAALQMALWRRRPAPGLIHHSDRGSQYCAKNYQAPRFPPSWLIRRLPDKSRSTSRRVGRHQTTLSGSGHPKLTDGTQQVWMTLAEYRETDVFIDLLRIWSGHKDF